MPVLPFVEDTEENVLAVTEAAAEAGARYIYPAFGMTQRQGQRSWYLDRLEAAFPGTHHPSDPLCPRACRLPARTAPGSSLRSLPWISATVTLSRKSRTGPGILISNKGKELAVWQL